MKKHIKINYPLSLYSIFLLWLLFSLTAHAEGDTKYIQLDEPTVIYNNIDSVKPREYLSMSVSTPLWNNPEYERKETEVYVFNNEKRDSSWGITSYLASLANFNNYEAQTDYEYVPIESKYMTHDKIYDCVECEDKNYVCFYDDELVYVPLNTVIADYEAVSPYPILNTGNVLKVVAETEDTYEIIRREEKEGETHGYISKDYAVTEFVTDFEKPVYQSEEELKEARYTHDKVEGDGNISEDRLELVNNALTHLGGKYTFNGNDFDDGVDCSAFVYLLYKDLGMEIGKNTVWQLIDGKGEFKNLNDLEIGDLIYYTTDNKNPNHVAMYIGNNECVEAKSEAIGICIYPIEYDKILTIKSYL